MGMLPGVVSRWSERHQAVIGLQAQASDRAGLILSASKAPNDIDIVSAGQSAEVRLSALSGPTTPTLIGNVTQVSADRIFQDNDNGESRSFYKARVEIPARELKKLGRQKLQAGRPAEVLINTGEQIVLNYLIRPITDAMSRGFIEK